MDIEKLIEHLERRGLSNGSSLGPHSGLYDEAADAFTALLAENEKLRAEMSQARESLDFARTKDAEILRLGMELGHLKKHMERLTHRLGNGELTCNMARDDCRKMGGDCQIDSKILDRLAAYEKTGMAPEEIELLAKQRDLYVDACGELPLKRIRELAQADREGRCVVMPCEVGSKVYMPFCDEVVEKRIGQFLVNGYTEPRIWTDIDCDWATTQRVRWDLAFGKTVFLTREEAEAALRREQE